MAVKQVEKNDGPDRQGVVLPPHESFDLFLPLVDEFGFRDQRELMERPFFALSTSRSKPINYLSPDGKVSVHVSGNSTYGLATIWDADILIYLTSTLSEMRRSGRNDIPRRINISGYDLLRALGRPTGGKNYQLLTDALNRLVSTTIKTNVRDVKRRESTFSWLDSWSHVVREDEIADHNIGITIELSNWFYEGVSERSVLSIDPRYFAIRGGIDRWLYRVARKHAGGHGEQGFSMRFKTLYEKSGVQDRYTKFKQRLIKIVDKNELPGISLEIEGPIKTPNPKLLMKIRQDEAGPEETVSRAKQKGRRKNVVPIPQQTVKPEDEQAYEPEKDMADPNAVQRLLGAAGKAIGNKADFGFPTDDTISLLRAECPGWDLQQMNVEFQQWLRQDNRRQPANYQGAFIQFMRRHHAEHKHELPGYLR